MKDTDFWLNGESALYDSCCIDESEENNGKTDESTDYYFLQGGSLLWVFQGEIYCIGVQ